MIKFDDIKLDDSDYKISLTKLTGKKIKDIHGWITSEFGDACIKVTGIVFEDGSEVGMGGEHDVAFIETYRDVPDNLDAETLERLYEESNE